MSVLSFLKWYASFIPSKFASPKSIQSYTENLWISQHPLTHKKPSASSPTCFSGVLNGRYSDTEIMNLSRFIYVTKFLPLIFRNTHPIPPLIKSKYLTPREELIRTSKGKCDHCLWKCTRSKSSVRNKSPLSRWWWFGYEHCSTWAILVPFQPQKRKRSEIFCSYMHQWVTPEESCTTKMLFG